MPSGANVLIKYVVNAQDALKKLNALGNTLNTGVAQGAKNAAAAASTLSSRLNSATAGVQKATASVAAMNQRYQAFQKTITSVGSRLKLLGGGAGGGNIFGGLKTSFDDIQGRVSKFGDSVGNSIHRGFLGGARTLNTFREQLMNVNDAIRLSSQGITNLGRSMMFFVSLPLGAALSAAAKTAIDFNDSLVRVAKTTGLSDAGLEKLTNNLRRVAVNSSSTHTELALIAETLGQQGMGAVETPQGLVEMPNALTKMTQTVDMFAKSTAQSGQEAALALGKIAAAYGKNLNTATDDVFKMANVINFLENTTAASAKEIQDALLEFAPFASLIGINEASAAGFAATLVAMGLSASEAGTSLKNMTLQVPRHAEELAIALKGVNSELDTADKIIAAMNKDATGFFMDLVTAAEGGNDRVERLLTLMEVANIRGGRGLANFANNANLLRTNMANANAEWGRATSLMQEYERAMSSTKSQIQLLKNNINDAAITAGDAFLPIINQVIQVLVPVIRMASEAFKGLGKDQQLLFAGLAVGLVVIGPLLMFFGQLVHAVTLVTMGFGQLLRVVSFLMAGVGVLIPKIIALATAFVGWPGAVVLAGIGILKVLQGIGVDVAGFFTGIANRAVTWGENLAANLSNGLLAGAVRYVTQAITFIANLISRFFESHSPPKDGPLSTIDKWGVGLMKTFLGGFKDADFSVLRDVGSIIERALTMGVDNDAMPEALKKVASARESISQLISKFNSTGIVDEGLLDRITNGLSEIKDETKNVLRLWVQYNSLQERISQIEQRRKSVNKDYLNEVAAIGRSNLALKDKIAAIRALQRNRDDSLSGLNEEQAVLEDQSSELKTQLDYQKNLISAVQDQQGLFDRIAKAIESLAEKMSKLGGAGDVPSFGGLGGGEDDTEDGGSSVFQDIADQALEVKERFDKGKQALQGFLDAWNGQGWDVGALANPETAELYETLYRLGQRAGEARDSFLSFRDSLSTAFEQVKTVIGDAQTKVVDFQSSLNVDLSTLPGISGFLKGFSEGFDEGVWNTILDGFKSIQEGVQKLISFFSDSKNTEGVKILFGALLEGATVLAGFLAGKAATTLGTFLGVLGKIIGFVIGNLPTILAFGAAFGTIMGAAGAISGFITAGGAIGALVPILAGLAPVLAVIGSVVTALISPVGLLAAAAGLLAAAWVGNWGDIQGKVAGVVAWFTGSAVPAISGFATTVSEFFQSKVLPIINAVGGAFGEIAAKYLPMAQQAFSNLAPGISALVSVFQNFWSQLVVTVGYYIKLLQVNLALAMPIITAIVDFIKGLLIGAGAVILGIIGLVVGAIGGILGAIGPLVSGITMLISGIIQVVSGLVNVLIGLFGLIWNTISALFTGNWEPVLNSLRTFLEGIVQIFYGLWHSIVGIVTGLIGGVIGLIDGFITSIIAFFTTLSDILVGNSIIPDMMDDIVTSITTGLSTALETVKTWVSDFVLAAHELVAGLIQGVKDKATEFIETVVGIGKSALEGIKKLLGISSPSSIFADIGVNLIQGLINGISGMLGALGDVVGKIGGTILEGAKKFFGGGDTKTDVPSLLPDTAAMEKDASRVTAIVDEAVHKIKGAWTSLMSLIQSTWVTAFSGVSLSLSTFYQGMIETVIPGIGTNWQLMTAKILELWSGMWVSIKFTLDQYVPVLSRMLSDVANLLQLSMLGVARATSTAQDAVNNFAVAVGKVDAGAVDGVAGAFAAVITQTRDATGAVSDFVKSLDKLQNKVITITIQAVTSTTGAVAKASGGMVVAGNYYNINELGGEGFIPNTNGRIVPANIMRDIGSMNGDNEGLVSINVNINHPVVRDDKDLQKLITELKSALAKSLQQQKRMGGVV